jgi:hypothetical protein
MSITDRHRDAESRFRKLLTDAALPEPDDVEYEHESVVFFWHAPKVAVFVDFDRSQTPASDTPFGSAADRC